MYVNYQWSADGVIERCRIIKHNCIDTQSYCYHCGCAIKPGELVIVLQAPNGDIYELHHHCFIKNTF